jgi:hypothetical protein
MAEVVEEKQKEVSQKEIKLKIWLSTTGNKSPKALACVDWKGS